jgi:LmbE family N-acetylglucosaminyl deacetylase
VNVLVIAPHPDDESVGCGGTLALHAQKRGDRVAAVFLTSGELGLKQLKPDEAWRIREHEAERAAGILGIASLDFLRQPDWYLGDHVDAAARLLLPIISRENPETIYLPHSNEWHPDHQASLPIVQSALGDRAEGVRLLTYEIWTPLGTHDHVEDISAVAHQKLAAIRCHESQVSQLPYDRAARGLALYRGAIAGGCRYAEVFQSV